MPRNGSGTMDISGADFTNGTLADANDVMTKFNDVESALTASIAKDGQTTPTAALPMGTFNHTNVGVATARTHYARASQIADGALTYGGVAGGTADALTITPSPAITAYVIGQQFQFKVGASANTTAATLNVNTVGAGAVTWPDGTALVAGDLPANAMVLVEVQATTPVFHLQTQTRAPGTFSGAITAPSATFTSTDAGAGAGPTVTLYRNSASPAASDVIGEVKFDGEDSAGNTETYGRVFGSIVDATSTSEDGRVNFETVVAGTAATRGYVQNGLVMGSATGGDKGAGTINAAGLYHNGVVAGRPLLATKTASGSAQLDFTVADGFDTTLYAGYEFWVENILPATDGASLRALLSVDAGVSYLATGTYSENYTGMTAALNGSSSGSQTYMTLAASVDSTTGNGVSGRVDMISGGAVAYGSSIVSHVRFVESTAAGHIMSVCSGSNSTTSQVNGIRFVMSSGNITSGTIRIYGVPK